ncbi:IS30 family transposase, partial [Candidatus Terasakiella magnetica]|uniref:IS30 family transposase n=1 Tax=Candidatus Terasakiella magnetica TaxID=1867952 RepID=UPI001969C649
RTEFAYHYRLTEKLNIEIFFCDPHAPWQKGAVEVSIARLRPYLPRKTKLEDINQHDIDEIIHQQNHTPRKCLGYKTPHEVFWENLNTVALQL